MPPDIARPSELNQTTINSPVSPPNTDEQKPRSTGNNLLAAGLTALAIMLMTISAVLQLPAERHFNPPLAEAVTAAFAGGAALLLALRLSPHKVQVGQVAQQPMIGGRVRWWLIIVGGLLLMFGTEMSANVFKSALYDLSSNVQFITLFTGLVLFTAGMIGVRRLSVPRIHLLWREALPIVAILALAFLVRVYGLDTLLHMAVDEGQHMAGTWEFLNPNNNPHLLTTSSSGLPVTRFYYYGNFATTLLWGRNLIGLRMASVIIGSLTVLAAYGTGRALFNHRIGILSALFLATFPPHVFFSRVSIASIADPFFGTLAIMFAARAFRWNRHADWVLLGVNLGLSQYFFEGGRLLFPIAFAGWIILTALTQREKFKPLLTGVALALITNSVVIAPMYFTMWYREVPFTNRLNDSGIELNLFARVLSGELGGNAPRDLFNHVTDPFFAYTFNWHRHMPDLYSGTEPLVLRICVPLFLLGVFHCMGRFRSATLLLLIAIFGAAFGNVLVRNPLVFPRYLAVVPTLAIFVAIGLGCTLPMLNPFPGRERDQVLITRRWAVALMFGLAGMFSAVQAYYVFAHLIPEFNFAYRASFQFRDVVDAAFRFVERPNARHEQVIVYDNRNAVPFIAIELANYSVGPSDYQLEVKHAYEITMENLDALPRDRTYVFFVEPTDSRLIDLLHQSFTLEPPAYSPWQNSMVSTLYIMLVAQQAENEQPLHLQDT